MAALTLDDQGWSLFQFDVTNLWSGDGLGADMLYGYGGHNSLYASGGNDTIYLGNGDMVDGGAGTDAAYLVETAAVAVSNVEYVVGSGGADTIRFFAGATTVVGGNGGDAVALAGNAMRDQVVFSRIGDGGSGGANWDYDTISGFEVGTDKIVIYGDLRTALDRNGDGVLNETPTVLTTRVTGALADDGFANFRTAVGATNEGGLWIASNGVDTGLYLIAPPDGDSTLRTAEIRLLGVVQGAILTAADIGL